MSDGLSIMELIYVLGFIFFVLLICELIVYISYCKDLKQFLIKNQMPTKWYWLPYYSTYLMGRVIEKEVEHLEYDVKNEKAIGGEKNE